MRFDYFAEEIAPLPGETGLQTVHVPILLANVVGPLRTYLIRGLVDTGAQETLLPLHYLKNLGVVRGERYALTAANQTPIYAWLGVVDFELSRGPTTYRWSARVGFTPRRNIAIFGQASFLDHFTAIFDGLRHRLTLQPNGTFPAPTFGVD